jgi:RimJ/RimL family protein N-acetyltransferase
MPEDATSLFRWINDVEAARLDLAFRPFDWVQFKNWIESLSKDSSRILFAIRKLDTKPIVGFIGFSSINAVHRSADIGIRIGEAADRGQGYGKDALKVSLDYAWKHLNLNRVALTMLAHNENALRTFLAVGFEREGLARRAAFIDGRWCDVLLMAALRPDSTG